MKRDRDLPIDRRQLLGSIAAVGGTISLAGCLGGDGNGDDSAATASGTDLSEQSMPTITLLNADDQSHELHVLAYMGEERFHWQTYDLDADSEVALEDLEAPDEGESQTESEDESGRSLTIVTRLSDADQWEESTIDADDSDCTDVMVRVDAEGSLTTWASTDC